MRVQSETLAEETFARSAQGVANFGTRGGVRVDRRRTKLLMNHQINRDVTDAYLSTTAPIRSTTGGTAHGVRRDHTQPQRRPRSRRKAYAAVSRGGARQSGF